MVHLGPGETRHLVVFHAVTSTLCLLLPAAPATQVTICWDYYYTLYSDIYTVLPPLL